MVNEGKNWHCKLRVHDSKPTLCTVGLGSPQKIDALVLQTPVLNLETLDQWGPVVLRMSAAVGDRASGEKWNSLTWVLQHLIP